MHSTYESEILITSKIMVEKVVSRTRNILQKMLLTCSIFFVDVSAFGIV